MPLIQDDLTPGVGAVVSVVLNVSNNRRVVLLKNNFPIPASVIVRAQIDTGASLSAFRPEVFQSLGITPIGTLPISTPADGPGESNEYEIIHVALSLEANGTLHLLKEMEVMAVNCWSDGEPATALLGRDILDLCIFQYLGRAGRFTFAF